MIFVLQENVYRFLKIAFLISTIFLFGMFCYVVGREFVPKVQKIIYSKPISWEIPRDKIKIHSLPNGMKVFLMQDSSKPKVFMQVAYNVGSASENSYERGLAHLIEHMIFKGTDKLTESDIPEITRKYGASSNATTSYDNTSYYFETCKNDWKPFLQIMADCMKNAKFSDEHLASELRAVVQELNMRKDNPICSMFEKAMELLFPPNHPYHFPIIGFKEELASVFSQDLKDFYQRHYQPSKAVLFVIGDINIDEVFNYAKECFGDIESEESETESTDAFPPVFSGLNEVNFVMYKDIKKEDICYFWQIPGLDSSNDAAWDLIGKYLCNGENAILRKKLVDEKMVADSLSGMFLRLKRNGIGMIFVSPKDGQAAACEKYLKTELAQIITNGVSQADIIKMVPVMAKDFIEEQRSFHSVANGLMKEYFAKGDFFQYFSYIDELYKLNSESVTDLIQKYLSVSTVKKITISPISEDKKSIWESNDALIKKQEKKVLDAHVRSIPIEEASFANNFRDPEFTELNIPVPTSQNEFNGLNTIFYKDNRYPIVDFKMLFKDFSFYDYSISSATLDLLMNLLLEGCREGTKLELHDFFDAMGASVSFSSNGISCSVLSSNLIPVLEKVFTIIRKPLFKKDAFEKIKDIAINMVYRSQDDPSTLASNAFRQALFKGTEFDYSLEDYLSALKKVSLSDVLEMYNKIISPAHMVAGFAGDFNLDAIQPIMERCTRKWQQQVSYEAAIIPNTTTAPSQLNITLLRDQAIILLGSAIPVTLDSPEHPLLRIASIMAFTGFGSRFYKIRERSGLFYSLRGSFTGTSQIGYWSISTLLNPLNMESGEESIKAELNNIVENGFLESEIVAAKAYFQNFLIGTIYSNKSLIEQFIKFSILGLPFDFYKEYWNKIRNADIESINQVVKKVIDPTQASCIKVGNIS